MVFCVLTYCALFLFMCDLKAARKSNSEIGLYEFELGHKAAEVTKIICCVKNQSAVDYSTVIRGLKKCKGKSSEFNTERVTGEFRISQSSMLGHLHDLWVPLSYGLVPHLSKKLSKLPPS